MFKIATLVGCAVGDALGNPFEMKMANYQPLQEWDGQFKEGGTFWHGQPGQYTDDTLMSIALATSLVEYNGFNLRDVGAKYLAWMESGNTRGIGGTTAKALTRLKLGYSIEEAGVSHNENGTPASGNGTAMRASPIGLFYRNDLEKLIEVAMADAAITHNSHEPKMGSVAVALGAALAAKKDNNLFLPHHILEEVHEVMAPSIVKDKLALAIAHIKNDSDPKQALAAIGAGGYVPETVGAAFYCFATGQDFTEVVVMAVKAGGDTDTTAAVAGALAGTYYGLEGIPDSYKDKVENFELLQSLTDELINNEI